MIRQVTWVLGAPLRWLLLAVILAYRATLGQVLVGRCRFHPTCSAYAVDAIRSHGALKGSVLAAWRLARCSPLSAGGLDYVPPGGTWRSRSVV